MCHLICFSTFTLNFKIVYIFFKMFHFSPYTYKFVKKKMSMQLIVGSWMEKDLHERGRRFEIFGNNIIEDSDSPILPYPN
jgi:hypothetical protein